jgi:hypothetical protein
MGGDGADPETPLAVSSGKYLEASPDDASFFVFEHRPSSKCQGASRTDGCQEDSRRAAGPRNHPRLCPPKIMSRLKLTALIARARSRSPAFSSTPMARRPLERILRGRKRDAPSSGREECGRRPQEASALIYKPSSLMPLYADACVSTGTTHVGTFGGGRPE